MRFLEIQGNLEGGDTFWSNDVSDVRHSELAILLEATFVALNEAGKMRIINDRFNNRLVRKL